tara:strand:- start:2533 stop:3519 length:987 start_codon:yes stop_codon:yes gene_type:complete
MEKSKFKKLIQGMVFEMLEGKGTAPGSTTGATLRGAPGTVSKGGFTLQDFSKVLGGVGGSRTRGKDAGGKGSRGNVRASKWSLFKGGRNIDKWRLAVLQGGSGVGKTHKTSAKNVTPQHAYMQTKSKTKDVSTNISSLAAIRKTDDVFIRKTGGRKIQVASSRMKVSAAYINQKSAAITAYENMISSQKESIEKQIDDMVNGGGSGTIEHMALHELLLDMAIRLQEYEVKWEYATAAYSGNTSAMEAARRSLENLKDERLSRSKQVGSGHYSGKPSVSPWQEKGNYKFGDKVTGKSGRTFLAIGGKWGEASLGKTDPESDHPMWQPQK